MSRSLGLLPTPNSNRERAYGVPVDDEFKRIDALPRRRWTKHQKQRLQLKLTERLKAPHGARVLWEDQAVALQEIEWYGGIVGGVRVSGGKSTIGFLAASMLPDVPQPLLITPSKSIKTGKVQRAYDEERKHWRVRDDYAWYAYEHLQRDGGLDYLFNLKPGIVILDEAHWAGRYDTRRTSRIHKYKEAYPHVVIIVLSGSLIASRVVNDSLTLCHWARRQHSPLPLPTAKATQRFWKLALDIPQRTEPAALRRWCGPGESTVAGVGRRYYETPGVVCSAGKNVIGTTLNASTELVRLTEPSVLRAFDAIRNGNQPDGRRIFDADGKSTWLQAQTIALGFYYVYDPEPPTDWLDAKRNWTSYCREHIASTDCDCDTENRVKEHIRASGDECWPLEDWELVAHKYKLRRKAVWLSRSRVDATQRWMDRHKTGLVWCQFRAFGEALAPKPYYGSQARCRGSGKYITDHVKGTAAAASIKVCSEDLNLQHQFTECLYVAPPATGAWIEQSCARFHRFGQPEPEVNMHFWIACAENRDNLAVAKAREKAAAAMTGDYSRKMLIADWTKEKLKDLEGPQWQTTKISKALML